MQRGFDKLADCEERAIVVTPPHSPLIPKAVLHITSALQGVTTYHRSFVDGRHWADVVGADFHCESTHLGTALSISLIFRV